MRSRPSLNLPCGFAFAGTAVVVLCALGAMPSEAADLQTLETEAVQAAVDHVAASVVQIETVGGLEQVEDVLFGSGATTGLVVDPDGYVLSSSFAFANLPASILVRLPDGSRHAAKLVATDHNRRIVLLKIDADRPLPVPRAVPENEMRVGAWAIAVGRTFDVAQTNISVGIISAVNRIWGKAVQTDAAVSPNNYGGPLVDIRGRVFGLIVPLSPEQDEEVAGLEWYDSGIGFAIPLADLADTIEKLKQGEDLHAGVAGFGFPRNGLYTAEPVVAYVRRGSPANKAGLKKGDRVLEIDGRPIARPADVREAIGRRYAGQTIQVIVLRGNQRIQRDIELATKLLPYEPPFVGFLPMRNPKAAGVVVRYLYPAGPAAKAGIEPGDVVVRMLDMPSSPSPSQLDAEELRRQVRDYQPGDRVKLEVRHDGKTEQLSLRLARVPVDLPPAALPPASEPAQSPKAGEAATGKIRLRIPEFSNEVWSYVPKDYSPAVPHGIVVWLHATGKVDTDATIRAWKPHCDRDHLILVAPQAEDPEAWHSGEVELVGRLLGEIDSVYTIDRTRVVAAGQELGGTVAYLVAFGNRELVRAVVAVDAASGERPPEYEPDQPLAVYSASAGKSQYAGRIDETLGWLRAEKYPVTVKDLGRAPRPLNAEELAEAARWIDMLDRI